MPETDPIPSEEALPDAEPPGSSIEHEPPQPAEIEKENAPMLDIHDAHHAASTWREFFIHIATIVLGLLIAVGLEQGVESINHRSERRQLEDDLRTEAESNLRVIDRDLHMQDIEPWFVQAQTAASIGKPRQDRVLRFRLAPPPCIAGSVGTAAIRYFAPSEAVWTAASESGLVALLPADQARLQARLAHNYILLAENRSTVYTGCQAIIAMRQRLAQPGPAGSDDTWIMTPEQAEKFAATASETKVAIQALDFRLRWSRIYEQSIARGETNEDVNMMTIDQTRFEDASHQ
jgi:hypothetical protein